MDFRLFAWANLAVTPHLHQVVILTALRPWLPAQTHGRYLAELRVDMWVNDGGWRWGGGDTRSGFLNAAVLNCDGAMPPLAFLAFPRALLTRWKCLNWLKWSRRRLGSREEVNWSSTCRRLSPPMGCYEFGQVHLQGEKWPVERSWAPCMAVRLHSVSKDNKPHLVCETETDVRADMWAH